MYYKCLNKSQKFLELPDSSHIDHMFLFRMSMSQVVHMLFFWMLYADITLTTTSLTNGMHS